MVIREEEKKTKYNDVKGMQEVFWHYNITGWPGWVVLTLVIASYAVHDEAARGLVILRHYNVTFWVVSTLVIIC